MDSTTDPSKRYLSSDYLKKNPSWDVDDSPWKAIQVMQILSDNSIQPRSIVEVGCGAGGVLASLRAKHPSVSMVGYDIAPAASSFWPQHVSMNIDFHVGDFLELNRLKHNVVLLLDVVEHLTDPFSFLTKLREHGELFIFHIPLDLSSFSVLRETPLLHVRDKVGHIHYFTKGLALALLRECGYQIIDWRYTNAYRSAPRLGWRALIASIPRTLLYKLNKDIGVRLLGGETLLVLARSVSQL
jgi:SAM-dependent methyltransferase